MTCGIWCRITRVRNLAILALAMVACACKSEDAAKHRAEQAAWAKQVIDDKAKKARVLQTGDPPRQVLGAPLVVGEALDADVVVSSTVKLRDAGGASPEITRTTTIRARIRLRAVQPVADDLPIALDVIGLSGDLRDLDKLLRSADIESGAHGEPWLCMLRSPSGGAAMLDAQRWLWQRDVCGLARRVLMPVPLEPLGVG